MDFYGSLFSSPMVHKTPVKSAIVDKGARLSPHHLSNLDCNFSMDEIKAVMDSIPTNKAPDMDGFNSMFFKASWDIV